MGRTKGSTRFPGVRYRQHSSRKVGVQYDRFFFIRHTVDGKRIEEAVGWMSEKWTAEKAFNLLSELKRNKRIGEGPRTLEEKRAIEDAVKAAAAKEARAQQKRDIPFKKFFKTVVLPDMQGRLKPETVEKAESHVRIWLAPVVGVLPFRLITLDHVETIRTNLITAKRTPRTQQYVFGTFSTIWNYAEDHGLTQKRCPTKAKSFRLPKVDNEKQRYLTIDEERRLLLAVRQRGEGAHRMAMVSFDMGLRFKEVASLTWGCVDLDAGTVKVLDSKGHDRYVPMTSRVRVLIESMVPGRPSELVFPDRYGQRMKQVPSSFKRGVVDAGLNEGVDNPKLKASFHCLRHTYASRLVQAGVDLYRVQRLLGHSTPVMTARYSKLADSDLKAAVEKMEQKNEIDRNRPEGSKIIRLHKVKK